MSKALLYVKSGGSLSAIKSKYKLTEVQEKELNGQTKNTEKAS